MVVVVVVSASKSSAHISHKTMSKGILFIMFFSHYGHIICCLDSLLCKAVLHFNASSDRRVTTAAMAQSLLALQCLIPVPVIYICVNSYPV